LLVFQIPVPRGFDPVPRIDCYLAAVVGDVGPVHPEGPRPVRDEVRARHPDLVPDAIDELRDLVGVFQLDPQHLLHLQQTDPGQVGDPLIHQVGVGDAHQDLIAGTQDRFHPTELDDDPPQAVAELDIISLVDPIRTRQQQSVQHLLGNPLACQAQGEGPHAPKGEDGLEEGDSHLHLQDIDQHEARDAVDGGSHEALEQSHPSKGIGMGIHVRPDPVRRQAFPRLAIQTA
jgi:hypothetical protein